jgi:hypothetical protein
MNTTTTNLTDATRNERTKYYVFQCTSLHPDQRQEGGKKPTEGCGKWCLKGSKKPLRYITNKRDIPDSDYETILQGRCVNHPENKDGSRKQRLNEDYLNIRTFDNRKDAQFTIDVLNGDDKPTTIEDPKFEFPVGVSLHEVKVPKPLGEKSVKTWERLAERERKIIAQQEAEQREHDDWLAFELNEEMHREAEKEFEESQKKNPLKKRGLY